MEFACDKAREGLRFESLPAVLEQFAAAFGGRAALALRPRPGELPAIIGVFPPGAADPVLLAQIGALVGEHPEVTVAGGCLRESLTPARPGSGHWPGSRPGVESALVAVTQPAPGRPLCALVLIGNSAHWTAETQATARTLVAVIAAQYRRASDTLELAEREEITRALVEASPDAVIIADATRRIVEFNAAAEQLLHRPRAEALGQDLRAVLVPERNHARFMAATDLFLRTGQSGEFVGTIQLPVLLGDGSELIVELTPLPLVVGDSTYFCCFLRDVSKLAHANAQLERANAALAASQARFELLSELAPVGMAWTDRGGVCTVVNERWCVLGGGSASDFTGQLWTQVLHPEDAGRVAQEWARARAEGAELRTDCRLRPNGGPQLWVQAAIAPLPDGDDQPAGFLVALANVSARKRAEEQGNRLLAAERAARRSLADQTERLSSLVAAAIPGVLFVDEHDVIVQLNQSYADLIGFQDPLDQLIGTPADRLVGYIERTLADPADFLTHVAKYRLARQRVAGVQFARADGRTVECDYWPVFVKRQYRGDLWLLWNMSGRVALEAQSQRRLDAELAARQAAGQAKLTLLERSARLREMDELKTQFLATVSRELRGPLTSIMSYTELISSGEQGLSAESAGFLDVVRRCAERLTQLVGDLVLLNGIEAGSVTLELAPAPVAALVADALRTAGPDAAGHGIALESSVQDGPPLLADRLRLEQLLGKLISNGVKFTDSGGQVQVTATYRDSEWRIDVADSGVGVPPGDLGQIFDPFFRASNARTAAVRGSGLGLSVVKSIAEMHGGRVEAASRAGGGTTFSVYLPVRP